MRIIALLIAAALLPSLSLAGDRTESVTTETQIHVDAGKGAHLTPRVRQLTELVRTKRFDDADKLAKALCSDYEALFQRDKRQFTFQTRADFEQFRATTKDDIEWIDWGYKIALQTQAFIASERKDYDKALATLSKIESKAPVSADTSIEFGYCLNHLSRPAEALAVYTRAQTIAEKYESQHPYRAAILRGIGFSLIELADLDKAQKAFEDSLKLEPDNKVALNELEYIRQKRAKK